MCADSYIDAATLGHFVSTTGGQLHYYPQFRVIEIYFVRMYTYTMSIFLIQVTVSGIFKPEACLVLEIVFVQTSVCVFVYVCVSAPPDY